jgi:hypothetical protein
MEKIKVSKKALQNLLNDSIGEAITKLELPLPTKKVKKLIYKSSSKIAVEFAGILKKQNKRALKAEKSLTFVEDVLKGKKNKKERGSKSKKIQIA